MQTRICCLLVAIVYTTVLWGWLSFSLSQFSFPILPQDFSFVSRKLVQLMLSELNTHGPLLTLPDVKSMERLQDLSKRQQDQLNERKLNERRLREKTFNFFSSPSRTTCIKKRQRGGKSASSFGTFQFSDMIAALQES